MIKEWLMRFRSWLIGKIFSQDEKYLLTRAIEDRINNLERISVNERWANKEDIQDDCDDYMKLREVFMWDGA